MSEEVIYKHLHRQNSVVRNSLLRDHVEGNIPRQTKIFRLKEGREREE